MSEFVVRAHGLGKRYASFRGQPVEALRDFSLEVRPGEIFGLLGPNGAGKTTFIKAILGIVRPTSGSAELLGLPIGAPESRNRLGYLPEQHRFPGHLTAAQALNLYGRLSGMDAPTRAAESERLLQRVGLADWAHVKVKKFSKGMMQRLGLAQALMGDPDLVILDEPTDGVDPIGRKEIREIVSWLASAGKTIFLNSHLLSEVEMICTRVAILNNGRLVSEGSVADLTRAPAAYVVQATPLDAPLPAGVSHDGARPWARYRIEAESPEELTAGLSALIAAGAVIKSVEPGKKSLEQAFVDIVADVEGAA